MKDNMQVQDDIQTQEDIKAQDDIQIQGDIQTQDNINTQEVVSMKKESTAAKYAKAILFGGGMVLLFLAIQIVVAIVAVSIKIVMMMQGGTDINAVMSQYQDVVTEPDFLTNMSAVATLFCAVTFALWYKLKYAKRAMMGKVSDTLKRAFGTNNTILYVLGAISCYLIALDVISIINLINPDTVDAYTEMMELAMSGDGIVVFIMTVILAPIGEECMLRGVVLKYSLKKISPAAAIIFSAILFGIVHGNIVQGLYVLPLGLIAGYAAYRSSSVLPAIFIHFVYNFTPNVVDLLPDTILENDWVWVFAPIIPIAALIVLWKRTLNKEAVANDHES